MRTKRFAEITLALTLAAAGAVTLLPPGVAHAAKAAAPMKADGNHEALAALVAADEHEVQMAKQAIAKKVGGGVLEFAKRMVADHGANLAQTRKVAHDAKVSLSDTASVRAMKKTGMSEHASLAKLSGAAYSKAYVDAMVKGHQEVLAKLDSTLIPGASDATVIAHLKTTREAVAAHLAAAQALQAASK